MQLEHSFSVPVGIDEAWRILLDIERIGPCMPGAAIDSVDGDDFTGTVKVKLGPINLTYKGKASFVEKDEGAHRAVIDARGRDARGNGTAAAKVTAVLTETGGFTTTVQVNTDLDITGKPAQFGRGVMVDVGNKLIGQFADSLASTITAGDSGAAVDSGEQPASASTAEEAAEPAPVATPAPDPEKVPAKKASRPKPARAAAGPAETAAEAAQPATPEPAAAEPAAAEPAAADPTAADPTAADPTASEPASSEPAASEPAAVTAVNGHSARTANQPRPEVEPMNLLESAGPAVAKRLAPVAVAMVVVLLAVRRRRAKRA